MILDDFEKEAKAKYQAAIDLISRREKIKAELVQSNAATFVTVGGKKMTIAAAIEEKRVIGSKEKLLEVLRSQSTTVLSKIENARAKIDGQIQKLVESNTGKDRKTDKEDYDRIAEPIIAANELFLVDPLNVKEKIETLDTYIEDFKADVDITLSESNAKTEIEIGD